MTTPVQPADFSVLPLLNPKPSKPQAKQPVGPKPKLAQPTGPPQPALQAAGFNGSIHDFNQRVQAVTDAHQNALGVKPPPGLAFDVARSPLDTSIFPTLFSGPMTQRQAQARNAIAATGGAPLGTGVVTPKTLATGILNAAQTGTLDSFLSTHADVVKQYAKNPAVAGAIFKANRLEEIRLVEQKANRGEITGLQATQQVKAMGFAPGGAAYKDTAGFVGGVATGIGQVANSLVHAPGGVYQLGKAVTLDVNDIAHGHFTPERTAAIAVAMGRQMWQDVKHPNENPGYLFLDVLGLASLGGGAAARLAAAGKVASAGEGTAAVARAVLTKPNTGTFQIGRAGAEENAILSSNPTVAAAQKLLLRHRQKNLDLTTINGEKTPGPLQSILIPATARDIIDEHFSFPAKIGKEADARRRVEHTVAMTVARELDHVSGTAKVLPRVYGRLPAQVRNGLSRGEQKAIWVAATDAADPLKANLDFHRRMIDLEIGDPKAHLRQIADLKLAEKALKNPSPRLVKALALTQDVVAEMERIKVDQLGLSPVTAEGRVAKLGQALRGEEIVGGEKVNPESFYLPTQPRGKVKRPPSDRMGFYATKPGPYGIPLPRSLPELNHEFTGKAIQAGDIRVDATNLATEAYARTVRAATVLNEHQRLWKTATDTPRTRFDVPIRDSQKIPDQLRAALADISDGGITPEDAAALPKDLQTVIHELYPDKETVLKTPIEGVKWIDGRMLGGAADIPTRPGAALKVAQAVNEPIRAAILFLRPAYLLNALGNSAMLLFDQGLATVPAMARAIRAGIDPETVGGETVLRTIDDLMGQGRAKSYTSTLSTKASQKLAQSWNVVTDQAFRRSSFLYWAHKLGYDTPEKIAQLVTGGGKDLVEIKRRANKSLVEFDNLTPFEKNVLRNIIFVYPWVSRSAVWSLREVMEHPAKTDLLTQLGRLDENSDPIFKNVPQWFKQTGYFPIGWNQDGTPKIVNPTSVNTFSTLGQITQLFGAGLGGTKYASFSDLLGPVPSFALHGAFGIDQYGNKYPDKQWLRAAQEVLLQLPQVSVFTRNAKAAKNPPLKPVDITRRSSLSASLNSALRRTVFTPGWLDGYGTLIAGGLSPRGEDQSAAAARYWRDATPQARHQLELALLNKALDMQGELLKATPSPAVRSAVRSAANLTFQYSQFAKKHGRQPTRKEEAQIAIDYLAGRGKLSTSQADTLTRDLAPMTDEGDISTFRNKLMNDHAGGHDLAQWDADVRLVASFDKQTFQTKTSSLYAQGLIKSAVPRVPQDQLYQYGRAYLAFTRQVKQIKDKIQAGKATAADLRAFEDKHDKPVGSLPSFVRTAWAYLPKDQQRKAIEANVTASWSSLTSLEKQLLGRPTDPRVTVGWAKLTDLVAEQRAALRREGRSFPRAYGRTLAKYVERYYDAPGLVKDYDFAHEPLFRRMSSLRPVQDSPHADLWRGVFASAAVYERYLKSGEYNNTQVQQSWRDYVTNDLQPWVAQHPEFKAEIDGYGKNLLSRLLG